MASQKRRRFVLKSERVGEGPKFGTPSKSRGFLMASSPGKTEKKKCFQSDLFFRPVTFLLTMTERWVIVWARRRKQCRFLIVEKKMDNYLEMPPLFVPRQVIVHPAASEEFGPLFIGSVLWRHLRGDKGDWFAIHYDDLREGDPLNCLYCFWRLDRGLKGVNQEKGE